MSTDTGEQQDVDPLVVAKRVVNQTLHRWPWMARWRDDLESDACLGATTALLSHDPTKAANLGPRMHRRATGAVMDGIRMRAPVSRAEWAKGMRQDDLPQWRRWTESVEEIREHGTDPADPGDVAAGVASADRVEWLLGRLSPLDALVVRAYYLEGAVDTQIAEALGVSHTAICKRRKTAIRRLRTLLDGYAAAGAHP